MILSSFLPSTSTHWGRMLIGVVFEVIVGNDILSIFQSRALYFLEKLVAGKNILRPQLERHNPTGIGGGIGIPCWRQQLCIFGIDVRQVRVQKGSIFVLTKCGLPVTRPFFNCTCFTYHIA